MHPFLNRRGFLAHTATGLGGMALAHLLGSGRALGASIRPEINPANPNATRPAHVSPQAKRVLMLLRVLSVCVWNQ